MHYILVVHGTWNAPDGTKRMWYQLDTSDPTNFCRRLNEWLEANDLAKVVWPSRDGPVSEFSWSGENDHTARGEAAGRLADLMLQIVRSDSHARIHLIGHSHGGNVVLKAIDLHFQKVAAEARQLLFRTLQGSAEDVTRTVDNAMDRTFVDGSDARRATARPMLEDVARRALPLLAQDYLFQLAIRRGVAATALRLQFLFLRPGPLRELYADFAARWASANGVASATFLGTPFYRKVWRRRRRVVSLLRRLPGTIVAVSLMSLPLIYASVMLYSAVLAVLPSVTMLSWNPVAWPTWLKALTILSAIIALVMFAAEADTQDTNLYFDELAVSRSRPHMPIPALVISANRLDEALVALSAEPFAFALLVPQLRAMLVRPTRWSLPEHPAGRVTTTSAGGDALLRFVLQSMSNIGYALVAPFWIPLRNWLVTPLLTEVLLNTINASAFGIPPDELSTARCVVGSRLGIPAWFEERYRDVAQLLLHAPPQTAPAVRADAAAARYEFLSIDERLEEKMRSSVLWKKLQGSLPDLRRRYAAQDAGMDDRDLALNVVALEERLKETVGNIDLNHSWYYTNEDVIRMIADFIATATPSRAPS